MGRRLESEEGFQNDYVPGYYHQFVEDDFNFQPETITIMPTTPPVHLDYSVLYFKLSEKVIDAKRDLVKSLLNIHLPQAPSEFETRVIIHVFYISEDKSGKTIMSPAKENKVQLRTNARGRVEINLTHLTRKWMKYPMENLGLVIKVQIENNYERELEIGQVGTTETPFLQINIQDGAWRSRVKRTTSRVCSEEFDPEVTQCCKWPLKIDFAEFGWDWVLSPKTYDADFCAGDCSLGVVSEYPHTNLMQMS